MQDIIAVVFDFDDTLAPDSTSSYLESIGINVPLFWQNKVQPLISAGWDPVPSYLYAMLQESKCNAKITKESFENWGRKIIPYQGAARLFGRIEKHLKAINPKISAEFYIISSGIGDIIRNTKIAKSFTDIWTCDFHYSKDGDIEFPKNIISFTDKTRYLFQISKGITGIDSRSKPFDVNKKFENKHIRIPFENIIYVGDGYTDIPCFSLVRKQRGIAIGVFDKSNKKKWGRAWGFIAEDRVSNLVPADYGKDSALSISLIMAIENIANRITLNQKTYQG